ncbi:MAG TPA: flagellar hook-basal body complex protein FliE [Acetobacteraceae bacterium]|nr:flagellar hook-basal body complex protein FliE [Acetobacteraceae bacterium]
MTDIPTITVTPRAAAQAYARAAGGAEGAAGSEDFGTALGNALGAAVAQGHEAEQLAAAAIAGQGDLTTVVTALSQAQLTLQTATAIRDRVLQAYQSIMQMPI